MGNRLIVSAPTAEPTGPPESTVKFFKTVRVKWLEYFVSELKTRIGKAPTDHLDMNDSTMFLKWKDYFSIFSVIQVKIKEENIREERASWHISTLGYVMERDDGKREYSQIPPPPLPDFPEGLTDDEPTSDVGESDHEVDGGNEESTEADVKKRREKKGKSAKEIREEFPPPVIAPKEGTYRDPLLPDGWDPELISPLFYGYKLDKATDIENAAKRLEIETKEAEARAVERALEVRNKGIAEIEVTNKKRAAIRLKKMAEIEAAYAKSQKEREEELSRQRSKLKEHPAAFKSFQKEWDAENDGAKEAYTTEMDLMKNQHYLKTTADRNQLLKKVQDLDAFKDIESQDMPSAERLEQIARVELHYWIDQLEVLTKTLDVARKDYYSVKQEYGDQVQSENKSKANEATTLLNFQAESVRNRQKDLKEGLQALNDAEVLLGRAYRMKSQQEMLLPLFKLISGEDIPRSVRFDYMLAALSILTVGTFESKCDFVLDMLDSSKTGYMSVNDLHRTVLLFHNTMYRMKLFNMPPNEEDLRNILFRAYFERGLSLDDSLTRYEVKQTLKQFCSHSGPASLMLGIFKPESLCTYQRNAMSPLKLLDLGLISATTCKYRNHYDASKYRPQLEPSRMAYIHERAFLMGEEDPNRPDYTAFIATKSVKKRSIVDPLSHGHLNNRNYVEEKDKLYCVQKLQALFRSRRDRIKAEARAKQAAFEEAKEFAMAEMKKKIMDEFRNREAGSGVGKLKWDAQVRMRQAKLRSSGQKLSRNDTVMLMMEEAISRATAEIVEKFEAIAVKEGYIKPETDEIVERHVSSGANSLMAMFGIRDRPIVADSDAVLASISTPRADDEELEEDDEEKAEKERAKQASRDALVVKMSPATTLLILQGLQKYEPMNPSIRGESIAMRELRLAMAISWPTIEQMRNRLMTVSQSFTSIKAEGFLEALPSKRLMMQMIETMSITQLADELESYFGLSRDHETVAIILKAIVKTDMERGIFLQNLTDLTGRYDTQVRGMLESEMDKKLPVLELRVSSRLKSSIGATESDIISKEVENIQDNVNKFIDASRETMESKQRLADKFKKTVMSIMELEKRRDALLMLDCRKKGVPFHINVRTETRQNWMKRLNTAMKAKETTKEEKESKYSEIRLVGKEFLQFATADAITIIGEYYLPKYLRTISITSETHVDGKAPTSGRGVDGKSLTFEAHNICYRVMTDDHGIFNGSDECAAKAASNERHGSLQYLKTHTKGLHVPLIATIDYFGFRVLAVSKLDCAEVIFNDDGEVRKIKEDLVHGVQNKGANFVNKSKACNAVMKTAASKLNLMDHEVKGMKDVSHSHTTCSCDIKLYRGPETTNEFYAKDFWLAMPAEDPVVTPHLPSAPRQQSVFWRLLRPEFVQRFNKPLSANAFSMLTAESSDREKQLENIREASTYLMKEIIPSFLNELSERDYLLPVDYGLGLNLSHELHTRGISLRHLGYIRHAFFRKLPGSARIYFDESFIRTARDLRDEVSDGDVIKGAGQTFTVQITLDNPLTYDRIPVSAKFLGDAVEKITLTIAASFMRTEKNAENLRAVLLGEMVARAAKSIIRELLRAYVKKEKCISPEFTALMYCEYFNILTGASYKTAQVLQEEIFEKIREKYGNCAVGNGERDNFQLTLRPVIVYMIRRLQMMLGVKLSIACIAEFNERPVGFAFCPVDFIETAPVVRHNMPFMIFADAMLVSLRAMESEKHTYENLIESEEPALYFKLQDRKGTRELRNKGTIETNALAAKLSASCVLERPGPISFDKHSRSIFFNADDKARMDSKYHPLVVPQSVHSHFTVEIYAKCTGGTGSRYALMSGRFAILCNRENEWIFVYIDGIHEIFIKIAPMVPNEWTHLLCTYDGTTVRCYKDAILQSTLEIETPLAVKRFERSGELEEKHEKLNEEEKHEREAQKDATVKQAAAYFKTAPGQAEIKKAMKVILESYEFQSQNIGIDAADPVAAANARKQAAKKQATEEYTTELYLKNVHEIASRYTTLRNEIEEELQRDITAGENRLRKGLRLGASNATNVATHFFQGYLAHVAVYPKCLQLDTIMDHYMASITDKTKDSHRLYAVASARYEDALKFVADDPVITRNFAFSLCRILDIEMSATTAMGISRGKTKVLESIEMFKKQQLADGIGEIMMAMPRNVEYADLICEGLMAIFEIDVQYFSRQLSMSRKDLVPIPFEYALDNVENPPKFLATAARIFQEVVRDPTLAKNYGEVDLQFIQLIKTPELVVAIIKSVYEDVNLHILNVGELYRYAGRTTINVNDDDVQILSENLPLTVGFDLSYCSLLTNKCSLYLSRCTELKVLNLEGCINLTDGALDIVADTCSITLEFLSMAGIANISDKCFEKIVEKCKALTLLNVSGCPNITHEILFDLLKANKRINTLLASATYITDEGLSNMANVMSQKYLTNLDLSFCREISDFGIISITERCTSLSTLNLCGLNRVTDNAARAVCANFWKLKSLSLEDVFLLEDSAFFFDRVRDGRPIADESMLTSLTSLNLKDCVNITDRALEGLGDRCRQLENLNLRGCEKLSDGALQLMYDNFGFKVGLCDSIKVLDLAYCAGVSTKGILDLLSYCGRVEDFCVEGIVGVDDDFVHQMCVTCRTITKLSLRRCQMISNASLCSIVDFLWIEKLDLSYCTKITDPGIEVFSAVCCAVRELILRRLYKLTPQMLFALARNCKDLQLLDIRECTNIDDESVAMMKKFHSKATVLKSDDDNNDNRGESKE